MLKDFAWRTFENTGYIDAYVFLKEMEAKNKALKEQSTAQEEVAISK